jgi:hypothetical protein
VTVELEPGGGLFATLTIQPPAVVQVMQPWDPNVEPRPIPPGSLDAFETCSDRIYWQWQQDPNWQSLAEIIASALDIVVTEQFEIDQLRWIETGARGVLDDWGALVDLPRNGLGDGVYRRAIYARGASTIGDAGIDAVMRPIKILLGAQNVSYAPAYPRGFCWIVHIALSFELLELVVSLVSVSVAGCGIGAKILLAPPESPGWDWSTPQAWAASWSSAYGPVDQSVAAPWGWSVAIS